MGALVGEQDPHALLGRFRGSRVEIDSGVAEIDPCARFLLLLPGPGGAFGTMDMGGDRSAELEAVERGRYPGRAPTR